MKEFRALLLGIKRENEMAINSLTHNMSALYMNGSSHMAGSSHCGTSSSNSSDIE